MQSATVVSLESHEPSVPALLDPLTPRERDVAVLLAEGFTYKEIALNLGISPHTVNTHVKAVLRKLKISGSRRLAALIHRSGA
jgi:DNA-binding CsgD family transcriptional regulator